VGAFEVKDHSFPQSDIISQGRSAWDTVFATVNLGKFFLGFGAVGLCEHAFAEADAHVRHRILFGKPVSQMPHIRDATAFAFARLTAMKLYAYRALDYLQVAGANDRRYLLFNAVQKAKVSTEGVKVLGLLSECIAARGFEADTFFESALREAQMVPSLESSTHINFALAAQFIDAWFAPAGAAVQVVAPASLQETDLDENPYWVESDDRHARTVRFADCLAGYRPLRSVPNVRTFMQQVKVFRRFARRGGCAGDPGADTGLPIALGKCFAIIAYAQLIVENCLAGKVEASLVAVVFHALIEDLGVEALKLSAMFLPESAPRALLRRIVRIPRTSAADIESVSRLIAARYASGQ
jgi:acyl-CoA dehydrogenase